MKISYKRPFVQFVKKASKPLQLAIEDKVLQICTNPALGEKKLGDLKEILIFKFKFNRHEYLMAYRPEKSKEEIDIIAIGFYQIGTHENFYTELKRFMRQEPTSDKSNRGYI
ncbi:MAG: hypothetical protein RL517_1381 [Pseudomonadota bacterium]|jgi:hypothetical protein